MPTRFRPVQREIDRFRRDPASVRNATIVIIVITLAVVIVGSLVMWAFDKRDFPDFGSAFWFTLQTVTTVGYGDVTPVSTLGRVIGGIVMVVGIAFVAIVTAVITSTFVEAAQRRRQEAETSDRKDRTDHVDARFDEILERLGAIEVAVGVARAWAPSTQPANATPSDPPVPSDPPLPSDAPGTATGD